MEQRARANLDRAAQQGRAMPRPRAMLVYACLALLTAIFASPLVWMLSTSLKPTEQTMSSDFRLLPDPASSTFAQGAANYTDVWTDPSVTFPIYLRNTLIVAILSVAGMVLSSAIVAYGFSRVQWRGRAAAFAVVLASMMIPFPVLMAPTYLIFREMGLIGTFAPLWLPAFFASGFNVFMLRQFFMTLPRELDEAARLDGCSEWGIFWRIILPLSRPALAVVALLHFTYVWNDFINPLIFLSHRDQFTLALGLHLYQSQAGNTPWNLLMAASTLMVAPLIVVFFLAQREFVEGIGGEGLK